MTEIAKTPIEDAANAMLAADPVDDLPPCDHWLSTGSTLMDLAVSDRYPNGGVGGGRIVHFCGDSSTAKSVLVQEILGAAQRLNGHAVFEDAELTLDRSRARLFGMRTGRWQGDEIIELADDAKFINAAVADPLFTYRHPETIEGLFDTELAGVVKMLTDGKWRAPVAMGVDSLTALPAAGELAAELDKASYDTSRPKQFGKAFRKYLRAMSTLGITMVAIDQTRDNVTGYGKSYTYSGGNAIKFYSSTQVYLKHAGKITNKYDQVVGIKVEFTVEKNKIAPPHRTGWFNLLFDIGIDDLTSNIEWLREHAVLSPEESKEKEDMIADFDRRMLECKKASDRRVIKQEKEKALTKFDRASGWWSFEDTKFQSKDALVQYLEANDRAAAVEAEVARVWHIVHQPTGRRTRHGDML